MRISKKQWCKIQNIILNTVLYFSDVSKDFYWVFDAAWVSGSILEIIIIMICSCFFFPKTLVYLVMAAKLVNKFIVLENIKKVGFEEWYWIFVREDV